MYAVTVDVTSDQLRTTNVLSIPLAPTITAITKVSSSPAQAVIQVDFTPNVWPDQKVSLIVSDRQVPAPAHGQVGSLQFTIDSPPVGLTYIRLRVDGVDSLLITNYTAAPPVFDPTQAVTLP
jgi:hypothetical protein